MYCFHVDLLESHRRAYIGLYSYSEELRLLALYGKLIHISYLVGV